MISRRVWDWAPFDMIRSVAGSDNDDIGREQCGSEGSVEYLAGDGHDETEIELERTAQR